MNQEERTELVVGGDYSSWLEHGGVKMEDENKVEPAEDAKEKSRREFVKGAAKAAVVAPAVVMLLSATTKPAKAQIAYAD